MDSSFYFELLNKVSPVSAADFELISAHLKERPFRKNEILINPGDIQQSCYFMLEGVLMSYYDSGSKIHVQAFAYPPDLVAIPESFLQQNPSPHFLQCMNDARVLELPYDKFQHALSLSHALERVFRLMTERVLIGILKRHTELHSMSIEERFRSFTKRSPHLLQLVPHKYIASYLNIDPTNFSKLYNAIKI
jgi:CRP-like cAMP-binding protein